jgi:hypothetical protein
LLDQHHLPKAGLRFFFPHADNQQIERRAEYGTSIMPPVPSHQIDRGRFENELGELVQEMGVCFWDDAKVGELTLDTPQHTVAIKRQGVTHSVNARWIVDATGYSGSLKRQLGLVKVVDHTANAVWFRLDAVINTHDWSADTTFRSHFSEEMRRLSTTHLMGNGYWVWLIPLPSGGTSVGIVVDAEMHPMSGMNRFEKAVAWLERHEPQCAAAVIAQRETLQDFRTLRNYSHSCEQVFSAERWAITGVAGVFLDPFYSPGTDFIAISNGFITTLVEHDLAGEPVDELVVGYERIYFSLFDVFLALYHQQYKFMGNAPVMLAKIVWDFTVYWAAVTLLYTQDKLTDLPFMGEMGQDIFHMTRLNVHMQQFFRAWAQVETQPVADAFVDNYKIDFLLRLHCGLHDVLTDDELKRQLSDNADFIETLAFNIIAEVGESWPELAREFGRIKTLYRRGKPTPTQNRLDLDLSWLYVGQPA